MNAKLEKYLNTVEKHLNPLPASERIDIVKEIKSLIIELENDNVPTEIIINRLGDPKELAKAYLGNLLANSKGFSWNRILIICAFYSIVGFSGMIVIPCLAIIAPVFMICGIATPILAAIKMIDYIFSLGIPYMQNIGILLDGLVELNPIVEFICCVPVGALLVNVKSSAPHKSCAAVHWRRLL